MSTSISSIASSHSSGRNSAVTATNSRKPSSEDLFKKADSDGNGSLSSSELVQISPEGAEAANAQDRAAEALKRMDSDGNGELSQSEFAAAAPPDNAHKPAGARPAGPPPGAAAGTQSTSEADASSTDPADSNEDGQVSQQERLAYETKQAAQQLSRAAAEAVQAYAQVAEA